MRTGLAEFVLRVPVHPGNNPALIRTRNSDRIRRPFCLHPQTTHRDSIELVAVSATLPGTTRFETLVLETSRRRDRRRSLDRNRACLLWSVTLHHAENGYTRCATAACRSSIPFRYRNACRFVEIYERGDLYSKRTRRFIGSLHLCQTQRRMTPSRRP